MSSPDSTHSTCAAFDTSWTSNGVTLSQTLRSSLTQGSQAHSLCLCSANSIGSDTFSIWQTDGSPKTFCMASWLAVKKAAPPPLHFRNVYEQNIKVLDIDTTSGKSLPVTEANGGKSLTAPSGEERPKDSKLQMKKKKKECSARAIRQQQPHQQRLFLMSWPIQSQQALLHQLISAPEAQTCISGNQNKNACKTIFPFFILQLLHI